VDEEGVVVEDPPGFVPPQLPSISSTKLQVLVVVLPDPFKLYVQVVAAP
jgi:hypothetical protein